MPTLVKANGQNVDQRGNDDGAAFTLPTVEIHTGTTTTRTGLSLGATDYGYYFWDTDLSAMYMWYGASWDLAPKWAGGAALVTVNSLTATVGGQSEKITISAVSAVSAAITSGSATVFSNVDCFYRVGAAPVALNTGVDDILPAGNKLRISGIPSGEKLAFITASGGGTVYITAGG